MTIVFIRDESVGVDIGSSVVTLALRLVCE